VCTKHIQVGHIEWWKICFNEFRRVQVIQVYSLSKSKSQFCRPGKEIMPFKKMPYQRRNQKGNKKLL
jgi:hypothetical protein